MVRDNMTMPKTDLLRARIKALAAMADTGFLLDLKAKNQSKDGAFQQALKPARVN